MKTSSFRLLLAAAILTGSALFAGAQTRERVYDVSSFNAIDVKSSFEVTVYKGAYGVKLTADSALADYVSVYVKGGTLYIACDDKAIPKEVKKMYRGKNAPVAVLRATIYMPVLEGVTLDDSASLIGAELFEGGNFNLYQGGESQVKNLSIHASSANLQLKKKATASVSMDVEGELEASTENNAQLRLDSRARDLSLTTGGSSSVNVSTELVSALTVNSDGSSQVSVGMTAAKAYIGAAGSAKVAVSGAASGLNVKGSRNCNIDVKDLPVPTADVEMNGGNLTLSASETLNVDLSGGASVYYNGNPQFNISKILKSTLAPVGTK